MAIVAAAAVTAAIVVSLPHHESPKRKAVATYVTRVDAVESRMSSSISKVMSAYQAFSSSRTISPKTARGLAAAETTLTTLETRIAALSAPKQALKLRSLVLGLVREEASITHEVSTIARFNPSFRAALLELTSAATRLGHRLSAAQPPKPHKIHGTPAAIARAQREFTAAANAAAAQQAVAVEGYDSVVSQLIRRLQRLKPPPVLAPAYHAQLASLEATRVAAENLATELRRPHRTRVAELSRAFAVASRRAQTIGAQKAEIAAVKAYDARVRAVSTAATAVQSELSRLQQSLP